MQTEKPIAILATGAYHGAANWCGANPFAALAADSASVLSFRYNDLGGLERLFDRNRGRALLILDDIRGNFRLHPRGSHVRFGAKPDLWCMGKAMANGYPISALLGS